MEINIQILNNMRNLLVDMTEFSPLASSISILLALVISVYLYEIIRFSEIISPDPGGMRIDDTSMV